MDWPGIWRSLFPGRMIEPDVKEEITFHIEGRVRELVERGWDEEEARVAVLERFGDVASVEEMCRAYDGQRVQREEGRMRMEAWMRDLRMAVRAMARRPGFAAVVVATLALGIGASTAVFSVVEGVLLRPLPFEEPAELAVVWQNDRATGTTREAASTADYFDYLERSRHFRDLAIFYEGTAVLMRAGAPALRITAAQIRANLPGILGISMQHGRTFRPDEDLPGGADVVLLADGFWRTELGGDPGVVGTTLTIDGRPHEVVGVLPPGVDVPSVDTDVWVPIRVTPAQATRQQHWVTVLGRLAEGSTVADAQAEMNRIMADLEAEYPGANVNRGAFVEPLADVGRADVELTLWALFGAVLAVLLVACVNVANLLLARGAARGRELAVLAAVGAGRVQILRRFLAEGMVVAVVSGVLGIAMAAVGLRALLAVVPGELLRLGEPSLSLPVLGFTVVTSVAVGGGFALLPALQSRRIDLQEVLKEGRSGQAVARMPIRRLLVSAQLGLAVVLLVGATLLIDTVRNLQAVDPGFESENLLRASFALPASRYPSFSTYPDWPEIHEFNRTVVEEMGTIPGVKSAALALNHALEPGFTNSFRIEGKPYDPSQGEMTTRMVSPGYLRTMEVGVVEGRSLRETDDLGSEPVIVINEEAARRYFPGENPLGQRVAFWGPTFRTIVGVVEDERMHGLTDEAPPAMYVSLFQAPQRGGGLSLLLRTVGPPLALADAVRSAMASVDSEVPVFGITTMEETVREATARERFATLVMGIFAAVGLFLAVLGVHGVLSYLVAQRGHEVGVRMALGATRRDIVRVVVGEGASMAAVGIALGVAGALAAGRLIRGLLFGVSATSPWIYVGVASMLGLVALGATMLPARKAASVDPVVSLRGQ